MSQKNNLDQLLEQARKQAPIMDIEEVHQLVNANTPAKVSARKSLFTTSKLLLMSSIISAIVLAVFLWPNQSPESTDQAIADKTPSIENATSPASAPTADKPNPTTPKVVEAVKPPIAEPRVGKPVNNPPKQNPNPKSDATYLSLTPEQLAPLGIKVKDGILEFSKKLDEFQYFTLRFTNRPYYTATTGNFPNGALTAMEHGYPIMLSDEQGANAIWFNYNHGTFERSWLTDQVEDFIPLRIKLDEKGDDAYPNVVVLWFLRNEAFVNALPAAEQAKLDANPDVYAFEIGEHFGATTPPEKFSADSLQVTQAQYSILTNRTIHQVDEHMLNQLHFNLEKDGLWYDNESAQWSYSIWQYTLENTLNGRGDFDVIKDQPWKYPAYISSENADHLNLSCLLASRESPTGSVLLNQFSAEKDDLIPLVFNVTNSSTLSTSLKNKWGAEYIVFWYRPSSRLSADLSKLGIELPEEFKNRRGPFIPLDKEEWALLHAKTKDGIYEYNYHFNDKDHHRIRTSATTGGLNIRINKTRPFLPKETYRPVGFSEMDGAQFRSPQNISLQMANDLLSSGNLVGFSTGLNENLIVWYKIDELPIDSFDEQTKFNINALKPGLYEIIFHRKTNISASASPNVLNYDPATAVIVDSKQMKSLGFSISDKHLSLKGKSSEGKFHFAMNDSTEMVNILMKNRLNLISKPFIIPYFISNQYWESPLASFVHMASKGETPNDPEVFMAERCEFVPIVYDVPFRDSFQLVVWYKPTWELFNLLGVHPEKQNAIRRRLQENCQNDMKIAYSGTQDYSFEELFENTPSNVRGVKMLQLSSAELAKLGIYVENQTILHNMGALSHKYTKYGSSFVIKTSKTATGDKVTLNDGNNTVIHLDTSYKNQKPIMPIMITDDLAQSLRSYVNTGANDSLSTPESRIQHYLNSSFLIPVLVETGKSYTSVDKLVGKLRPDCIFWYQPTERFLSQLPSEMAAEIRTEMAKIVEDQALETDFKVDLQSVTTAQKDTTESCQYFEICQNTKGAITQHAVYPNPAYEEVNVDITVSQACAAHISVATINGQVVLTKQVQLKGDVNNQTKLLIAHLNPGMYLINIETTEGDFYTQRVIKNR